MTRTATVFQCPLWVKSSPSVCFKFYHLSGWFRGIPDTRRSELHVNLLRHCQRIVDLDAEIRDGFLQFRTTQKEQSGHWASIEARAGFVLFLQFAKERTCDSQFRSTKNVSGHKPVHDAMPGYPRDLADGAELTNGH